MGNIGPYIHEKSKSPVWETGANVWETVCRLVYRPFPIRSFCAHPLGSFCAHPLEFHYIFCDPCGVLWLPLAPTRTTLLGRYPRPSGSRVPAHADYSPIESVSVVTAVVVACSWRWSHGIGSSSFLHCHDNPPEGKAVDANPCRSNCCDINPQKMVARFWPRIFIEKCAEFDFHANRA